MGDTSEDTRRGDGLDGQRLPPFCGPHGDSTPEPSWNQARALVSETHRRPSRRPFATHPTLVPLLRAPSFPSALPSQDSDLSARRPIALIRALELASWWTRQGHVCRHPRRGAGGRPNSHSQLCEPVTGELVRRSVFPGVTRTTGSCARVRRATPSRSLGRCLRRGAVSPAPPPALAASPPARRRIAPVPERGAGRPPASSSARAGLLALFP